jgi:hypothetical protein
MPESAAPSASNSNKCELDERNALHSFGRDPPFASDESPSHSPSKADFLRRLKGRHNRRQIPLNFTSNVQWLGAIDQTYSTIDKKSWTPPKGGVTVWHMTAET